MSISKLHIRNFKGIREAIDLELKPLNIFLGPNSSGKSSCIHALAALSQTLKLPNNTNPLLLDDEFAYVHLGRFIEIIHSKNYTDSISIGISIDSVPVFTGIHQKKRTYSFDPGSVQYSFKSTKRTQEIRLEDAEYAIGDNKLTAKRSFKGDHHRIIDHSTGYSISSTLGSGFLLNDRNFGSDPSAPSNFEKLRYLQYAVTSELRKVSYLGPFRQPPSRRYATRGSSPKEVGASGEATMTLLANEAVQSQSRKHIAQIQKWLKHLGLGTKIEVSRIASSDLFDVSVSLSDGVSFPLSDLGFGVSQVLPVLTQCSFAEPGAVLLFEQPEIHLHSLSARKLISVFLDTINEKQTKIVAETHSPELILQIQTELRNKALKKEDVAIYRVSRIDGASKIKKIEIEDDAEIYENWVNGISIE